jgi:putative membrane protein
MRTSARTVAVTLGAIAAAAVPTWAVASPDHASAPARAAHHGHVYGYGFGHHALLPAEVYLTRAAQSNRFEIVTGQLAQQRASSAAVKELGAMFVQHHTALLQQGAAVAAQLGITVPEGLSPSQQAIVDRLSQLSGRAFDAAWIRVQIHAHRAALRLNLRAAIRGENTAIRTLAQGALPIVTQHLGELLDLASDAYGRHYGGHHHYDHQR